MDKGILTERRWGFIDEGGAFIPVPKVPITLAGLQPPLSAVLYSGVREIIGISARNPALQGGKG